MNELITQIGEIVVRNPIVQFNEEVTLYSSHDLLLMYILMTESCLRNLETLFRCSQEG